MPVKTEGKERELGKEVKVMKDKVFHLAAGAERETEWVRLRERVGETVH